MTVSRVSWGEFWFTTRLVLSVLGRLRLLVPFLLYGCVQLVTLVALACFHVSPFSSVAEPVVRLLGGEAATHFPQFYIGLPSMTERSFLALHVVVGSLLLGAATVLFWNRFEHRSMSLGGAFRTARTLYPRLLAIALIVGLAATTLSTLFYRLATESAGGVLAGPFVARGISILLALVVQAVTTYAVPAVVISNLSLGRALRRTVEVVARNPAITLIVILVAFVPHVPWRYVASKSLVIVEKLKPELVAWVVGVDVLVGIVTTFFLVGAVTQLYLFATREEQ